MPTRTITGTILHPDGTPWVGGQMRFTPTDDTFRLSPDQTFPVVAVQVTTDDAGAFTVALESGLDVAYMVRLPSRRDTFNIVVPDGAATTLEVLRAAYVGVPVAADNVTTLVAPLLALKADVSALNAHTGNTANPHAVTKAQVGLGNADNTSDANKPVSTAQQTALDAKQPLHANLTAEAGLTGAADRVSYYTGVGAKALATLTTYGRSLIAAADAAATKTILALAKADVGLGNVDNTSDVNKPVSTAQATSIATKAALSHTHAVTDLPDFGEDGLFIKDDFVSFGSTSVGVGELGWVGGNGSAAGNVNAAGHPGICSRSTGTTAGTYTYMRLDSTAGGNLLPTELFDTTWVLRLGSSDTDTTLRFGLGADATADPPNNGIYVEKLYADTSWFGVTRAGAVQSRTADTNWHRVRIRRINGSTIGFSVDGGVEVTLTTNVPVAGVNPFFAVINQSTVSKQLDIDYFTLRMTGIDR
jgi:hypothetical protein